MARLEQDNSAKTTRRPASCPRDALLDDPAAKDCIHQAVSDGLNGLEQLSIS
jgi:hypothetical protein